MRRRCVIRVVADVPLMQGKGAPDAPAQSAMAPTVDMQRSEKVQQRIPQQQIPTVGRCKGM
jgi:hypothetical protein